VLRVPAQGDIHPRGRQFGRELGRSLRTALNGRTGSIAILVPYNETAFGVRAATGRTVRVHEGHDVPRAHEALRAVRDAAGDPRLALEAVLDLLHATCTGLTARLRADVQESFKTGHLVLGRRQACRPLCEALQPVVETPDSRGLAAAVARILAAPPGDIRIEFRETLEAIQSCASVQPDEADEAVMSSIRRRRYRPAANRIVTTIHRAKGLDFDHVTIAICARTPFPDTLAGRALLYTAMSRARRSLTILIPEDEASPLLSV